jgi:hypothetical protein
MRKAEMNLALSCIGEPLISKLIALRNVNRLGEHYETTKDQSKVAS